MENSIKNNMEKHGERYISAKGSPSLLGLVFWLYITSVAADTVVPDAGVFLQQLEKEQGFSLPEKTEPERPAAPQEMEKLQGQVITVNAFKFSGNTLLSDEQLQQVVAPFLNRPLDFEKLKSVARRVAEHYREAGWVVKAYLPQQQQDVK